jgi:hypothetical protein
VRLLWMLPASLAVSAFLKRGGGAKSRLSNVPDLRNACLRRLLIFVIQDFTEIHRLTGLVSVRAHRKRRQEVYEQVLPECKAAVHQVVSLLVLLFCL